jgi:hypothetical protein
VTRTLRSGRPTTILHKRSGGQLLPVKFEKSIQRRARVSVRRLHSGSVIDTSLPETFFRIANAGLDANPRILHQWSSGHRGKRTLRIPKADERGFDVTIECQTYGLYPSADEWHGAPWDVNTPNMSVEEICVGGVTWTSSRILVSMDW